MKVSIFGLGYVGTVTAACLARDGHTVIGVDINESKVAGISAGRSPVLEPQLKELIEHAVANHSLTATSDVARAVAATEISLICVGTPSNVNGSLRLDYVKRVCERIGRALKPLDRPHTVLVRSTVLPGTTKQILLPILEEHSRRKAGSELGIAMNPEFLREGSAIRDYDHPGQIVIGELDKRSGDAVVELYQTVDAPVVRTEIATAEMVKYVYNTFHAVKIAYANEIGNLCKAHDIDGREVMDIFCRDTELNISAAYLKPGFAFGGSCLPKDTRALKYRAKERDVEIPLLDAVLSSNQRQIERGIDMIQRIGRKKIGVLGLSFKAGTDDVRESPMVPLIETLVGRGYDVKVYDQTIELDDLVGANKSFLERGIPHISSLMLPTAEQVVDDAEVVVITPAFGEALPAIREDQTLIDLNGSGRFNGAVRGCYDGICW